MKQRAIVTGGAGFIGSHLTERLLDEGFDVVAIDNMSSGRKENIRHLLNSRFFKLVKEDLKEPENLIEMICNCDLIFHLAANPEVRVGETNPRIHFDENVLTTLNILEALRHVKEPKNMIFASTSTVYGEASLIPTPENYGPLIPISTYGASKLACEALIAGYVSTFNHKALILRLANIIGPRSNHGVIVDFIRKIRADPKQLEILGDGSQEKSYLHVTDCIDAMIHLTHKLVQSRKKVDIFNLGSSDKIRVKEIARIIAEEMNNLDVEYRYTGGIDGGRGWKGDVKIMQLSVDKLLNTGWKPRNASQQAVRLAARALIKEMQ